MLNKKSVVYSISIIGAIIILILFQITIISRGFYSISADESLHTVQAFLWSKNLYNENFIWLPFQRIFLGIFIHFFQDLIIVPRIISMIFGILNLTAVTYLTFLLFEDQVVTIITIFLSSIFSPILIFSVLPLLEIMYSFFIVMGFSFFIKWLKIKKPYALIISCCFFLVSNSIRYEAWLYSFSFFLILIYISYKEKTDLNLKLILVSGLFLFGFPALWITLDYFHSGELLNFARQVSGAYKTTGVTENFINNPFFQFVKTNLSSLNIIGIVSLLILIPKNGIIRKFSSFLFLSLLVMALFAFFGKTMPTHNFWRIANSWSILLLPLTAYTLSLFLKTKFNIKYLNSISFIIMTSIITIFFIRQDLKYTAHSYFTHSDLRTGQIVNQLINENKYSASCEQKFLIISTDWHYINVEASSQQPHLFKAVIKPGLKNDYLKMKQNITFNISRLKRECIEYIIAPDYLFEYYKANNVELSRIKTVGYWSIYKIIGL